MKRFFVFTAALTLPLQLLAQQKAFRPLQLDLNLAGIGVKTTYQPGPKTELDLGLGYGLSTVSSIRSKQYETPVNTSRASDAWTPDFYHSAYIKAGLLYKFIATKNATPSSGYAKLQYTGWLPASNLIHPEEPKAGYQHRLALKAGFRKALNQRQTRSISFEAGAAIWANHNLSFISAGPQLNINFINDLFTGR